MDRWAGHGDRNVDPILGSLHFCPRDLELFYNHFFPSNDIDSMLEMLQALPL